MTEPNDDARPKHKSAEAMQESITAKIIESLKEGVPLWVKPWTADRSTAAVSLPTNAISGRAFSGINILQLWSAQMERAYRSPLWCTFKQAQDIGARVKKGEKSTIVVYVNFLDHRDDKDKPADKRRKVAFLKTYLSFNLDQLENVPVAYLKPPAMLPPSEYKLAATRFAHDTGIDSINFGGTRAAYTPSIDQIQMPDLKCFISDEAFSGTLMHETIHASGHEKRLARKYGQRFGDEAYKLEELVAELGAAFLCAQLGIPPTTRSHASYIDHWIRQLGNDYTLLTKAASYASAGAAFMTARVGETRAARIAAE